MKYKITIGERAFDAESNGDGTFLVKSGNRDFTLSAVGIEILGGTIEEVKEPLSVEFYPSVGEVQRIIVIGTQLGETKNLVGFGSYVRVTVEEILPTMCDHEWDTSIVYTSHPGQIKCKKCGGMKFI